MECFIAHWIQNANMNILIRVRSPTLTKHWTMFTATAVNLAGLMWRNMFTAEAVNLAGIIWIFFWSPALLPPYPYKSILLLVPQAVLSPGGVQRGGSHIAEAHHRFRSWSRQRQRWYEAGARQRQGGQDVILGGFMKLQGGAVYAQPERQPQGRTREGEFTSTIQAPVSALRTLYLRQP